MVGRMKKGAKQAAQADLAAGMAPEEVMARHGVKSRRTLRAWKAEARQAEAKSGAATEAGCAAGDPAPDAPPVDASAGDPRQVGDAEAVLFLMRFGVAFTTRTAGMLVGFGPTAPLIQLQSRLSPDEEDMIRKCAPSLLPAFAKFSAWMESHGVAVVAILFASMMLPRVVTLGMAAKEIKKRERAARMPHRTDEPADREHQDEEPRAPAPAAARDAPNGTTISLYPRTGKP